MKIGSREKILAAREAEKAKAREGFGEAMELIEMGHRGTIKYFFEVTAPVSRNNASGARFTAPARPSTPCVRA